MAETLVLSTPHNPDFDEYPYDTNGNSILPPSNVSSMIVEAGEAAKSRRRGRLNARSFPTVALANETVICTAAPNVKEAEPYCDKKDISIAFTLIPQSVRVLRRVCAVHKISVPPIVTLLWSEAPTSTDSPDSMVKEKSRPDTEEPQAPLDSTEHAEVDPVVDFNNVEPKLEGYSVEPQLAKYVIVCPMGWHPDTINPEAAYSYIQYAKPLLTNDERNENRPTPNLRNIGPSPEELIATCDALAEQVKAAFPVEDAPSPSTSYPPLPPCPEWRTPAVPFRPATFAPLQSLNGPTGIGPSMLTSLRRLKREHEVVSRIQTATSYQWLPESVSSTVWGAETSTIPR
ncbi:hypothetical protein FRC02_007789 [Tulasnella sp. 418]|nr:hypothetical protein FRC02_007789 [Tulasnella sp. 418]